VSETKKWVLDHDEIVINEDGTYDFFHVYKKKEVKE